MGAFSHRAYSLPAPTEKSPDLLIEDSHRVRAGGRGSTTEGALEADGIGTVSPKEPSRDDFEATMRRVLGVDW